MSGDPEFKIPHQLIEPNQSLRSLSVDELRTKLGLGIKSGYRAVLQPFSGQNSLFDRIIGKHAAFASGYEDQCSAKYYADLFSLLRNSYGEINRIVEVGVLMGGATSILYGCAEMFDLELDLIDFDESCLQFTYERVRRTYGEPKRLRLYHGEVPHYVRDILSKENDVRALIQHDGAHSFQQVVLDLGSLYYQREKVHSLAVQDTHLRGYPHGFRFVDAAVHSIFGRNCSFTPIGTKYRASDELMMNPNAFGGDYFLADEPEGIYLLMKDNEFQYPHPRIPFEAFFS